MVKNWEPVKQDIRRLYIEEDEKLEEVMRRIKGTHGFQASYVLID